MLQSSSAGKKRLPTSDVPTSKKLLLTARRSCSNPGSAFYSVKNESLRAPTLTATGRTGTWEYQRATWACFCAHGHSRAIPGHSGFYAQLSTSRPRVSGTLAHTFTHTFTGKKLLPPARTRSVKRIYRMSFLYRQTTTRFFTE